MASTNQPTHFFHIPTGMRLLAIPHANVLGLISFFKKTHFCMRNIKNEPSATKEPCQERKPHWMDCKTGGGVTGSSGASCNDLTPMRSRFLVVLGVQVYDKAFWG
jgi:hypothetical protein